MVSIYVSIAMSAMFNGLRVTNRNKRNHGVMGIELIKGESFHGNFLHVQKGGTT